MTCWSDKEMLVNFIRHSFVVCDETSVSEAILQSPVISAKAGGVQLLMARLKTPQLAAFDEEFEDSSEVESTSGSPDIQIDFGHRLRSNTAIRLQELKAEKITQSRTKTVIWRHPENSVDLINNQFERKSVPKILKGSKTSLMSVLIANSPTVAENPFFDYTKFDGNFHPGSQVKNVKIYPIGQEWPISISVLSCAKVADLIGLICYHYTAEKRSPQLRYKTTQSYAVYMCEDNGEIDDDLPPLDRHENVGKFGFPILAMVELKSRSSEKNSPVKTASTGDTQFESNFTLITVCFTDGDTYELPLSSLEVPLKQIRQEVLTQRFAKLNEPQHRRLLEYSIEKLSEPGKSLNLDSPVKSAGTKQFCLIRANSVRASVESTNWHNRHDWMRKSRTAPQCFTIDLGESHNPESIRYYPATLVHKMRPSVSVNLTINGDRLEVIPAKRKTSIAGRFLPLNLASPSTVSQIAIDKLGGCEMVEKKSGGRVVFRILHKNETEWKSHTYEAEESVAKEFQEISERIISRRPVTAARQEFLRGSFHSAPRQSSMRKISTFSRIRRLQSFE